MTFWKTTSFKRLQKDWYSILKSEGFEDAEKITDDGKMVLVNLANKYKNKKPSHRTNFDTFKLKAEKKEYYFYLLWQKLQDAVFKNEIDEIILTCHIDGMRIKDIGAFLQEKGKKRCRTSIRVTIRRYEMAWGVRNYTPRQLNRKEP